jgi:hypothetical protein
MDLKKFLLSALIFFIVSFSGIEGFSFEKNIETRSIGSYFSEKIISGYTYQEVLIDGVWWIQVFDDKGNLIDEYPAD